MAKPKGGRRKTTWTKEHPGPGRPPGSGRVERCRVFMEKHGFAFLERVVTGDEEGSRSDMALRVKAAEILADRGYGKPAQSTDITTGGGGPLKFTLGPDNGGGDVG